VYTVFGAGSVGTVLAALLRDAGVDVCIAGRGACRTLRIEGAEESLAVRLPIVTVPQGTILLCVHEPDVADLCARWSGRTVVTFQNGVTAEEVAARYCAVIGGVWRMTCTLEREGVARFTRRGRVVVGRHPRGADDEVRALASDLRAAGLRVGVSDAIAADKWLKLFVNLTSAPNALVRGEDHALPAFGVVKAALLDEAREVFAAAGIVARSCDGEDASVPEYLAAQRRGGTRRQGRVYNATWRRLSRGLPQSERFHETIVDLALRAGVIAPHNAAMARLLDAAREPECYSAAEVLSALDGSRDAGGASSGSL